MLGQILTEFGGKVRLVFKDFPLASHEGARPAAEAARCAGERGLFWEYHDLLFMAQPAFSRENLLGYARRLRLPEAPFTACLDSRRFRDAIDKDIQEGRSLGVSGTPTFFVNGQRLVGLQPPEMFREAVQGALDDAPGKQP